MTPFNQVASSLLMERTYFRPLPEGSLCRLSVPNQCESAVNPPEHCPRVDGGLAPLSVWDSGVSQPPLPTDVRIDGAVYSPLTAEDIDCTQQVWQNGCTEAYCRSFLAGIEYTKFVMSIPYFLAVRRWCSMCSRSNHDI